MYYTCTVNVVLRILIIKCSEEIVRVCLTKLCLFLMECKSILIVDMYMVPTIRIVIILFIGNFFLI